MFFFILNLKLFSCFSQLTTKCLFISTDPNLLVSFGIITSPSLSRKLGLKQGQAKKYDRLYGDLYPVKTMNISNTTLDKALFVIENDNEMVSIVRIYLGN